MASTFLGHAAAGMPSGAADTASSAAIDTTGARVLVVAVGSYDTPTAAITDSAGNAWTGLSTITNGAHRLTCFYCLNPLTSASHTFTLTMSRSASFASFGVAAYGGDPLVYQGAAGATGGGTSISAGSITPAAPNSLVFSGLCCPASQGASSANNAGLSRIGFNWISGTANGSALAHGVVAATTPLVVAHTFTPSTGTGAAQTLVFSPAPSILPRVHHHRRMMGVS